MIRGMEKRGWLTMRRSGFVVPFRVVSLLGPWRLCSDEGVFKEDDVERGMSDECTVLYASELLSGC